MVNENTFHTLNSFQVEVLDDNVITYGDGLKVGCKKYIETIADYIVDKSDYNSKSLEEFSENCKPEQFLNLKRELFVCKIYTAWTLLLHMVDGHEDNPIIKRFLDLFFENISTKVPSFWVSDYEEQCEPFDKDCDFKVKYKRCQSRLQLSTSYIKQRFDYYKEGVHPRLEIQYHHMHKQFAYALSFNSVDRYIEFPETEEEVGFLNQHAVDWNEVVSKDYAKAAEEISDFVLQLLDYQTCAIEEMMSYPLDKNGKAYNREEGVTLSNPLKWRAISAELSSALRGAFDKIVTYKDNDVFFETDWDTFDNLNCRLFKTIEEKCFAIAEKYDLWVSQILPTRSNYEMVYCFSFYDNEGDWHSEIFVRRTNQPFSLLNIFSKKKVKFLIDTGVVGFSRPDLYAYHKVEYSYGKESTKLIRYKKGYKKDMLL